MNAISKITLALTIMASISLCERRAEACSRRRCCCYLAVHASPGGKNEESGQEKSFVPLAKSGTGTNKNQPTPTPEANDLTEIDTRLDRIEKLLGIPSATEADHESALVAGLAGMIAKDLLPIFIEEIRDGIKSKLAGHGKSGDSQPAPKPQQKPVTNEDLARMINELKLGMNASVKAGMREAIKDADFRKEFKEALNN